MIVENKISNHSYYFILTWSALWSSSYHETLLLSQHAEPSPSRRLQCWHVREPVTFHFNKPRAKWASCPASICFSSGFMEGRREEDMSDFPSAGWQAAAGLDMKSPTARWDTETERLEVHIPCYARFLKYSSNIVVCRLPALEQSNHRVLHKPVSLLCPFTTGHLEYCG